MQREGTPAGRRRKMEQWAAAAPPSAGLRGSMRKSRRGCSSLISAVRLITAVKCLLGRMRHLAMFSPGIEAVVDHEARQMGERKIGGGDGSTVSGWPREHFAGRLHRGFLDERDLVPLHQLAPPGVDLLVGVYLDPTYL